MKNKLIAAVSVFIIVIMCAAAFLWITGKKDADDNKLPEQIVGLNEIGQLIRPEVTQEKFEEIGEKIDLLAGNLRQEQISLSGGRNANTIWIMSVLCVVFAALVFGYVWYAILRPFDKMKKYTEGIAQGNFDMPLNYERSNYFGDFTWAFDSMRREITKARSCEREAIDNNKTVIATLSHDIKTPIASIRAYAEGLEANLNSNAKNRAKYLEVIIKKCDEVSQLTNDLFLHSLSDLDKLQINPEPENITDILEKTIREITAEQSDVTFNASYSEAKVSIDRSRFIQVIENIINNARKYAKTKIEITMEEKQDSLYIHFRDYGNGIPDEDMPFIFEKFYRGKNCKGEQGSGLGLYIVKYIMEQMKGFVLLHNHADGLEVTLTLPVLRIS